MMLCYDAFEIMDRLLDVKYRNINTTMTIMAAKQNGGEVDWLSSTRPV